MQRSRHEIAVRELITMAAIIFLGGNVALAQIPGLSAPVPQVGGGKEPPKKAVVSAEGPITVKESVSDHTIQKFLTMFVPKYPGVRTVRVAVDDGVVNLSGRVDDDDSRDEITDVVKRVQGVRVVMNQMKTDDEVMTAWQLTTREFGALGSYLARKWLLIVLAVGVVALAVGLARLFSDHSETLLGPFIGNMLLRSVVGSLISSLLVVGGFLLALAALRLTQVVLSILGLSAVVGLAVGFAFRDITENFIASVLLGVRRPFQIGDYVTVSGQSGVVKSLNTRATVLVTLEGNHVRIPNAVIFKEIMVNATASSSFRHSFDVVIPYDASTTAAIEAISGSLRSLSGVLSDPPPRTLVEGLEAGGVRLRAYFWSPTRGVDWLQLISDAKLKGKVALQASGVIPPSATGDKGATATAAAPAADNGHRGPTFTAAQARANNERDARKAAMAGPERQAPIERALEQPETRVSEEGTNLLVEQSTK